MEYEKETFIKCYETASKIVREQMGRFEDTNFEEKITVDIAIALYLYSNLKVIKE